MMLTTDEVARRLGGTVEGDGTRTLEGVASLSDARPVDLSFLTNVKYATQMAQTRAGAVLVGPQWKGTSPATLIRVKDPDVALSEAAVWFAPPPVRFLPGIHPSAVIAPGVRMGKEVYIGPHCVIAEGCTVGDRTVIEANGVIAPGCTIGADCHFYPLVSLREHTRVGDRVILHNGVVLGSDGFGYTHDGRGWVKIPQTGMVEVGDDAEIGANTTVDRARFGVTRIGKGVKIDNLVQIAHNVTIGDHSALAAQVGISGSTQVGAHARLAGQVGVSGHLHIGDGSVVGAQAGVIKDVPARTYVSGYFAKPHDLNLKLLALIDRLPDFKSRLVALEKEVQTLKDSRATGEGA
jgi:UDP-3-O-[3-hydroxymyristoyl] glucosamine N-acyltransferase